MPSGKKNPLDAEPSAKGNLTLINGRAKFATDEDRKLLRPLYTSHFATCADAAQHRRRP
jgi:hypothetical protein